MPAFAQGINWTDSFQSDSITGWDAGAYGADVLAPGYVGYSGQAAALQATGTAVDGVIVNAQAGNSYFAVSSPAGNVSTTDFGNASPGVFGNGFTTSVSVYLDPAMATSNGLAFAWNQGPVNLYNNQFGIQPYVYSGSGGSFTFETALVGGPTGSTVIPGINDGFANSTTAGWYTFTDQYYEIESPEPGTPGDLGVYMSVLSGDTTLASWDIVTTTPIADVSGNVNTAWGQFIPEQMATVAFDDSSLTYTTPEPVSMIFFGTGLVAVGGYMSRRKMARKA
jgi:hypothetical protein